MPDHRIRSVLGFAALLVTLALPACGGERAAEEGAPADSARFALLTAGPVSDAGWYAGGYEGLLLLRESPHRGALTWPMVDGLARPGLRDDPDGDRAGFVTSRADLRGCSRRRRRSSLLRFR